MKKIIAAAIVIMGFSGLVAEVLLLRELLIVFSGNELCIGIILANWLILEACGSYFLGRQAEKARNRIESFAIITVLFSLSLPAAVYLTRILKNIIGVSIGESIGFLPMFYSSFLILMPASILHGALFTYSCRIYPVSDRSESSSAGRVYVYETVGTIAGGIVCTYLLIPYLNAFQAALLLAMLNFAACLVLLLPCPKTGLFPKTVFVGLGLLFLFSGYLGVSGQADRLHRHSIKAQWKNQNIVHYQNSLYGNICVADNEGQYIFFLDGLPDMITPVPDITFVEEFVHLPLLAHPGPEKLLVLSGGAGGLINEALKHPSIETIEYAEPDPLVLELLGRFSTPLTQSELNDARVRIIHVDGRLLLKTTQDRYDVILIGTLNPSSLQSNRFFTKEFFSLAKRRLNKEGILVIGAPGSLTYLNEELKNLNNCIFSTLESVFSHIRVIPGDAVNLFLASDSHEISTIDMPRIKGRLKERNIKTTRIVPWHIENKLHPGWQGWFSGFIEEAGQKINYDFKPLGLFYSISHWNSLHAPSLRWVFMQIERTKLWMILLFIAVPLLIDCLLLVKRGKSLRTVIPFSIAATGFAGMTFSLMLIFAFQSLYGYVFSWIGLLMASFMTGAACGAALMTKFLAKIKKSDYIKIELALVCFAFGLSFIFGSAQPYLAGEALFLSLKTIFLTVSFLCGLLIGSQFPAANKLCLRDGESLSGTAGLLYASDLLGGWLGGIAGAVFLLPVLGLAGACIAVGALKLASLIMVLIAGSHEPA